MLNQYKTSVMVYEINSKRRRKEEEDMKLEYEQLIGQLAQFERATHIPVHPITPELASKCEDLEKME